MASRKQITAYVVQRLCWEYGDDFYYRRPDDDAPMRTFLDRKKAEEHRRELEWQHVKKEKINPFGYIDSPLEERSSLPMPQLLHRLRDAGIEIDREGDDQHYSFWEQYDKLPDENKRRVWRVIDRLRFFELIQMQIDLDA
jgi:hypothetical protein